MSANSYGLSENAMPSDWRRWTRLCRRTLRKSKERGRLDAYTAVAFPQRCMYIPNPAGRNRVNPARTLARFRAAKGLCREHCGRDYPTRERGRLARIHRRSVPLRTPAM